MMRRGLLRLLLFTAALVALPGLCAAAGERSMPTEERSLLTADGTLHVIRSGRAIDLGVQNVALSPGDNIIEWTSQSQDGTIATAIVPGTDSSSRKHGLQLSFDEQTGTLLLLWTEELDVYSQIRVGVLRDHVWSNWGLLPKQGFSRAFNPQMRVTHQGVTYLDEHDAVLTKTSSILSIIWWEDSLVAQARYATLFLDEETFDPSNLVIYDMPVLLGGGGDTHPDEIPTGAFRYPSLQLDGLGGAILASFADLHDQRFRVVRITFPDDQGKPSEAGNLKWNRRHIPIVGVTNEGPVARMTPILAADASEDAGVRTSIGAGYRPTLYWRDADNLRFTRLDGGDWTAVKAIRIDDATPYGRALDLVIGMGTRN